MMPPASWSMPGISAKITTAAAAAHTGPASLTAHTYLADRYTRLQLKMLWPRSVQKTARQRLMSQSIGP